MWHRYRLVPSNATIFGFWFQKEWLHICNRLNKNGGLTGLINWYTATDSRCTNFMVAGLSRRKSHADVAVPACSVFSVRIPYQAACQKWGKKQKPSSSSRKLSTKFGTGDLWQLCKSMNYIHSSVHLRPPVRITATWRKWGLLSTNYCYFNHQAFTYRSI